MPERLKVPRAGTPVPSIGRIVHFVLPDGPSAGQHRPALIVRTWGDEPTSAVQLVVFIDGSNDDTLVTPSGPLLAHWATSVRHAEAGLNEHGTYHWPEYVAPKG